MKRETTSVVSVEARQPFMADVDCTLWLGDCVEVLAGMEQGSVDAVVTSPPYMDARPDYASFDAYPDFFRELGRVSTGPALLNVGRIFRGRAEQLWWVEIVKGAARMNWALLDTLVWVKPNANPIHGQVLANSHEYILIFGRPGDVLNVDAVRTAYAPESLARMQRKYLNGGGVKGEIRPADGREANSGGARGRSYIEVNVGVEKGNPHPAPMPAALAEHLVTLATFPGQCVLDPFFGSGTTALAARKLGRTSVGIEQREDYCAQAAARLGQQSLLAATP